MVNQQLSQTRLPFVQAVANELGVDALQWRVLVEQIFPNARTVEAIAMAFAYCKARQLDIFKRPVHIVPMWSMARGAMVETVWPGIAEIRTTASRTGAYAGIDDVVFGKTVKKTFKGQIDEWQNGQKIATRDISEAISFPEYASVTVWRMVQGEKCAFHAKVYWEEAVATIEGSGVPNAMWTKRPRGQIDKCVEAAALRKAFPEELGNTYVAEEMEGKALDFVPGRPINDPLGIGDSAIAPRRAASGPPSAPKPQQATNPAETASASTASIVTECTVDLEAVRDGDASGYDEAWAPYARMQYDLPADVWSALVDVAALHYDRTHDERDRPTFDQFGTTGAGWDD